MNMNKQRVDEIRQAVDEGAEMHLLQVVSDRPPLRLDFQARVLVRELLDAIEAKPVDETPALVWFAKEVGLWEAQSDGIKGWGDHACPRYRVRMEDPDDIHGCVYTIHMSDEVLGLYRPGSTHRRWLTIEEAMEACETHEQFLLAKKADAAGEAETTDP